MVSLFLHKLFSFLNTFHWIVHGRWIKTSAPWHAQNSVKKKQYALSQPCLHQLVKGILLPQDGIWIIQSAKPATQNDVPFKRESTACKRECATVAEHTVANTWTVNKNFLRVFYLPYILTFCLACVCVQAWRTAPHLCQKLETLTWQVRKTYPNWPQWWLLRKTC